MPVEDPWEFKLIDVQFYWQHALEELTQGTFLQYANKGTHKQVYAHARVDKYELSEYESVEHDFSLQNFR